MFSSTVYNKSGLAKNYLLNQINEKLPTSGGTFTGDLSIGSNKIITTSDPTNDTHL